MRDVKYFDGTAEQRAARVAEMVAALTAQFPEVDPHVVEGAAVFFIPNVKPEPKRITTADGATVWCDNARYFYEMTDSRGWCPTFSDLASNLVLTDDECRAILDLAKEGKRHA